jgi:hypothetical protein
MKCCRLHLAMIMENVLIAISSLHEGPDLGRRRTRRRGAVTGVERLRWGCFYKHCISGLLIHMSQMHSHSFKFAD